MEENVFRTIIFPRVNFIKKKIRTIRMEHSIRVYSSRFRNFSISIENVFKL